MYLLITSLVIHYLEGGLLLNLIDKTAIMGVLIFSIYNYVIIVYKNYKKIKKSFKSTVKRAYRKIRKQKEIKTYLGGFTPKPTKPQNRVLFKNKNKTGVTLFILLFLPLSFVFIIYLYYYGYMHCKYCYDTDKTTGSLYHSFLHLIASISFNLLTYILV